MYKMCKWKVVKSFMLTIIIVTPFLSIGCNDRVRQAIVPNLFEGLNLIADGLLEGLEREVYPEGDNVSSSTNG